MRLYKIPLLAAALALCMALAGCKGKKEQAGSARTEFEQSVTAKDTAAVRQLVDKFFTFARNGQFAEAAGMLYRNDKSGDGTPEELDNDEMADVRGMLESVPMKGYSIEYIKFNEYYANEVLCRVIIREAEGDMPPVTTKMFFKPVSYLGNWVLCLTNTEYGDKGVVDPGKRDSLERAFGR